MATLERLGEHSGEDWAIMMMATNLRDELKPFIAKKELPFFDAIFSAISRHPDLFRRRGYTIQGMRFTQHKTDKKGHLLSTVADFGVTPPTDEHIARACAVGIPT